jgi:hypothetical protein
MLVQHTTLVFAAQEPFSALRSDLKQAIPAIHLFIKGEVHFSFLHTSFFILSQISATSLSLSLSLAGFTAARRARTLAKSES